LRVSLSRRHLSTRRSDGLRWRLLLPVGSFELVKRLFHAQHIRAQVKQLCCFASAELGLRRKHEELI
jgi:hypothetical protein